MPDFIEKGCERKTLDQYKIMVPRTVQYKACNENHFVPPNSFVAPLNLLNVPP